MGKVSAKSSKVAQKSDGNKNHYCGPGVTPGGLAQSVIVINGRGGVGKHTLIEFVAERYSVRNVSSITPIKEIATSVGWDGGKCERGRQLLADLKEAFVRYNDLPQKYVLGEYKKFKAVEQDVMFIHIREAAEIMKFRKAVPACRTILVTRDNGINGNADTSEQTMFDFDYDYIFDNSRPLEIAGPAFVKLIERIKKSRGTLPLLEVRQ